ncbi:MAG: hypothetical protein IJ436_00440 [Bacteroidaceae bacterium]|nr:hypothetical protein [Bacteroidaceae bacterium]
MNRRQQKFIVTKEGRLRLGMVKRHCELLKPGEACMGGGFYELDYITRKLLLSGASSEYGEPEWEEIKSLRISAYYRGLNIVYTPWDSWKEIFPVSERIDIVYE